MVTHGTNSGYTRHGCRCAECRQWNAQKNRRARDRKRTLLAPFKARPCADCGQHYPHYVMQFDHVLPGKRMDVSRAVLNRGREAVMDEVALSEVVCANCHAERTWRRAHPE